jgi:hypothetical protein
MIPGWLIWWLAAPVLEFLAAGLIVPPVLRRYPILLWPEKWLPAIRMRRQIRKMTDPGDRTRS